LIFVAIVGSLFTVGNETRNMFNYVSNKITSAHQNSSN
jgi:Flp pilus assembly pilin Flp